MGIIQRQGLQNAVITYTGIIIGFVSLLYVQPMFLTKEEIGLLRILISFSALAGTVFPLGTGSITLRYFPFFKNKAEKHYGFFGFMMLLPLVGYAIVALVLFFLKDFVLNQYRTESPLFTQYFNYVFLLIFIMGFIGVITNYSFALFRTIFPSLLSEIGMRAAYIGVILIYASGWVDLDNFIRLMIATYVGQFLLMLTFIFVIDKPSIKIDFDFLKKQNPQKMISYGMVLSFSAMANLGLKNIDVIILGKYVALSKVGVYALAAFIPTVIEAPLNALDKITGPQIADGWAKNRMDLIQVIYYKSTKYLMLIGGLLFLGINCNIAALYKIIPNNFSDGIPVVMIISIGTFINICTGVNGSILFNSSKFIYGTYLLFLLIFLAIVNNFLFIPRFGIAGAAMATALSAFIYNFLLFIFIWKKFKLQPFDINSIKTVLLIAFIFALNYFSPQLSNPYLEIIIKSVVISFVYLSAVYFLKIVPEFHHYLPWEKRK